jgi:histidine ammonia-lyase
MTRISQLESRVRVVPKESLEMDNAGIAALLTAANWEATLALSDKERSRMEESVHTLSHALSQGRKVYGVTQGFGPLVGYNANDSSTAHGLGLISHLAVGQGAPLSPGVTRLMLWFRLSGMKQGYSAVPVEFWLKLAALWNRGFTPVVPCEGSVSASGDLVPLAHAAFAFAGVGEAWDGTPAAGWTRVSAQRALAAIGAEGCSWSAREALAFVNGTSASLALVCHNHRAIMHLAHALAALTGRIAYLLGVDPMPYSPGVAEVRGHGGHIDAAKWIRSELMPEAPVKSGRPLQEPYSLRCAPQVIGAVIDQLSMQEDILMREALGCTDNPITWQGNVLHGGNFHALPVALCSDQQALGVHQLAFLAERQLALLLDPHHNGGKPPMLTPDPGPASGLAGVQIAATSFVAKIRQLAYPATLTALPTNLGNQDQVPMALNGANTVADMVRLAWLIIGSLALAVTQWTYLDRRSIGVGTIWADLATNFHPLHHDRALAAEVRQAAQTLEGMRIS